MDAFHYQQLIHNAPFGYASLKIVFNSDQLPVDYIFIEVNHTFEHLTGLKQADVINHLASDILPFIDAGFLSWIDEDQQAVLAGGLKEFEHYFTVLRRWFRIQAFSPQDGYFSIFFIDVTTEKEKSDQLEDFFMLSPDLMCMMDDQGHLIKLNYAWVSILGYDKDELINRLLLDLVHPDDCDQTEQNMRLFNKGEAILNFVNRISSHNGTYHSFEWRLHFHEKMVFAVARDISSRIKAEEMLVESEMYNRSLLAAIPDMIFVLDKFGRYIDFKSSVKSDLVMSADQFLNKQVSEVLPQKLAVQIMEGIHAILSNQSYPAFEYQLELDNDIRHFECRMSAFGISKVIALVQNITQRKTAEQALRESEQNFRSFFETMQDMIFIGDLNGKISYTNPVVTKKLGYSHDDLKSMNVLDFHPPTLRDEAHHLFFDMVYKNAELCPLPLIRKDGVLLPAETRVWFGKWNGEQCFFGISQDLSKEQEALQKFNMLFAHNPALMAVSELPSRVFVDVNKAMVEKTGYGRDEIVGKSAEELNLFVDSALQRYIAVQVQRKGTIQNEELLLRTKSGEILTGLFSGTLIESQGKSYFLTVMTDITPQKMAEEKLRHQTNRLATLIANLPGGILLETYDRKIEQANQMFCNLFCVSGLPDAMVGVDGVTTALHIKPLFVDGEKFLSRINEIMQDRQPVLNEVLELLDGRMLQRDYVPIVGSYNQIEHLWHYRDITEQKKVEEELAKQAQLQKILMDISSKYINIPLAEIGSAITSSLEELGRFVEADRSYIFEYDWENQVCNNTHEWCQVGVESQIEELQGLQLSDIPQWVTAHVKGNSINIPNVMDLPPDDSIRIILESQNIKSLMTIPMIDENGCIGFIGFDSVRKEHRYSVVEETLLKVFSQVLQNVRKRALLENNLITEKQKAEVANKAKSEFLANMSHEIRTPMNAILGFSEALYHKIQDPQQQRMVKSVLNSGNLLLSLLNDILDLSKIESGKLEILIQPVDIESLIKEIVFLFSEKAQTKGLELNVMLSSDLPGRLMLDEIRIKQVIFNLVGNAIKFTRNGYVNIKAAYFPSSDNEGLLQLEVEDTGIGIPESQQQIIFESFRQQSGQSNREFDGAGLGLAISKRLVEKMNGTISLKSWPEKGSIFTISFPSILRSQIDNSIREPGDNGQSGMFNNAHILVVDDVQSNIDAIESLLANAGVSIASALNGEEALEHLKHHLPDLILLDMLMPGMDGYEVASCIKHSVRLQHIPIVAYTASVFSNEKIESSGNFSGYLIKPVKREELFSVLKQFLNFSRDTSSSSHKDDWMKAMDLPVDILKKIPELISVLRNDYLSRWESIKGSLILFKIEGFATDLRGLGEEFGVSGLTDYAQNILDDVEMVDLESLRQHLDEFPLWLSRLEKVRVAHSINLE